MAINIYQMRSPHVVQAALAEIDATVDGERLITSTVMNDKSDDALHKTLAKLAHLDLSGRVRYDGAIMKATGGYCDVFAGTATITPNEAQENSGAAIVMKVAIKRLRIHIQKDRDFEMILAKELYIWSRLDHTNILQLQGFVLEGDYPVVIAEWMENGTLREYLQKRTDCSVEDMILGIANGVDYLHRQNVVHSDLKADNVLVNHLGDPLICDFGISRMLSSTVTFAGATSGGIKGSMRWMAYELLDLSSDGHHTKESDIWAFGMTVYEILTKQLPYVELRHDGLVMRAIVEGRLPSSPPELDNQRQYLCTVWDICKKCWITPAKDRITMTQVVDALKSVKQIDTSEENEDNSSRPNSGATSMHDNSSDDSDTRRVAYNHHGLNPERRSVSEDQDEPSNVANRPWWEVTLLARSNESILRERARYKHDFPASSDPRSKHIHPLLIDSQYTRLDFSSRPFSPRTVPKGSWISREYVPIYQGYLSQPAVYPYTKEIKITCPSLGQFREAWAIRVRPDRTVSVGDVLRLAYDQLQAPMTHAEWAKLPEKEEREAAKAFTRRCRESELARVQGVRRVDVLGKKHWFGGIKKIDDDNMVNFELLLDGEE